MKRIKFLIFVLLLMFSFNSAYSQENKTKECVTSETWGWYPCLSGMFDIVWEQCTTTFNNGKWQVRTFGTLTGQDTGDKYFVSAVENYNFQGSPSNQTYVFTREIVDEEGAIVGIMHILEHVTINANGELTAEIIDSFDECY